MQILDQEVFIMAPLQEYKAKRNFSGTPEPQGSAKVRGKEFRFVVQKHQASTLHYDFRLELGGVLKSWAIPKGPSMNTADKRLAVQVEDHPVDYITFSGMIPEGNYGAGKVEIWDQGIFYPVAGNQDPITEKQALLNIKRGEIKFILHGGKLYGGFVLIRLKNTDGHWLLIKQKDEYAPGGPVVPGGIQTSVPKKKSSLPLQKAKHTQSNEIVTTRKIGSHEVLLTHVNKIFWPKENITKGDLLTYYEKIAPLILPYLKDRPLSLRRTPNGITGTSFYHKDAGENAPPYVVTEQVRSGSTDKIVDYIVCNNAATLLYVANLGSIEMNPWNSTRKKPDHPTYIIIDIDPSEENSFDQVIETARAAGEILQRAGASYYCKTSGASGMHLYVPLNNKYDYQTARNFAQIIATLTQELVPGFTTLERKLDKRGNRIYIDYLQNSKGQTVASAYSVRPVPGALVSTPLAHKELKKGLHPSLFNIFNIHKRIKRYGDLFIEVLGKGNDIPRCLKNLGQ